MSQAQKYGGVKDAELSKEQKREFGGDTKMMLVYWYFFKDLTTGEMNKNPMFSEKWLGDIGDVITIKNKLYEIVDYAEEDFCYADTMGD